MSVIQVNGIGLYAETFGDPADPGILLVGVSMLTWADEFCERLAAGGRYVIRYDPRDAGQSVSYEPGAAPYTLRDLVSDAADLLNAFDLREAHVVGFSVGGWISQLLALDHPGRVASLTLISTRPTAPGPADPDLPEHAPELMTRLMSRPEPDWSDRAAVIESIVGRERLFAGTHPFDEAARRDLAGRIFDRTRNVKSSLTNIAFIDHGDRWRERLGEITAPTLVIHGTEDPFFPYGNGLALAKEIPGAELLPLEKTGHEIPRAVWDTVISAIHRQS